MRLERTIRKYREVIKEREVKAYLRRAGRSFTLMSKSRDRKL